MKILLLAQAQEDLDRVRDPLLRRIIRRLESLRDFPEMGSPMAGPFSGYRSTVVELFRIVYRILPSEIIEVAYIRDCRRRPLT
ncbi:MAG: type II toxin-antitoxin system RelE/ParE family toxin [Elusimicrobia bacterium]|nr:type II toxin-antitoxin system RelE/ParE family toxin [Elusimicrobiota bacterium]